METMQILKEMGVPDHLIYLLRNLYVGQEATVRTGYGTTDWFEIGKGVQGCTNRNLTKLWEAVEDRRAWCALVHGVMKSRTRLNN